MSYQFYPRPSDPCPSVGHCPHVGGAAIAMLVLRGNENQPLLQQLHGSIDTERARNRVRYQENQKLSAELEQVKLELKLERQNKFATNQQKQADATPEPDPEPEKPKGKREAPNGHPGWFRPMPTHHD